MKETPIFKITMFLLVLLVVTGCEDELQEFQLVNTVPCETEGVVEDPFIISDFECQANVELDQVTTVRNPTETGINTSLFVGEYIDQSSPEDALIINYGPLDVEENGLFTFKIRAEVTGETLVRLQGGDDDPISITQTIFGNVAWQKLEFDFSEFETHDFTEIAIVFNAGVETNGDETYYIDEIRFEPVVDPCADTVTNLSIISDFECQQNYFLGDPNLTETAVPVIDNPNLSGINTSSQVGIYTDNGTEPFDNLLIDFSEPIDLSINAQFSIKVYAPITGPVIAKLEGGTTEVEKTALISQINQWVELTFDFTEAQGADNTRLILFFNAGATNGSETDVYYIDDLQFVPIVEECEGIEPNLSIISDFECQDNYDVAIPIVENPAPNDVNMSSSVGAYTDNGTDPFDALIVDLGGVFDLTDRAQLSIKVLTDMEAPLEAKLEGGDNPPVQVTTLMDTVGEWSEYTFDFTQAIGSDHTTLVLFFNVGLENGTPTDTYYIDDLQFLPITAGCDGVEPDLFIVSDFECQNNYDLTLPIVDNPAPDDVNMSSSVGEYTDDGTLPFDALIIPLGGEFDLSVNNQFKVKVLSTITGPILAKLEGGDFVEIYQDIVTVNEWVEYTFDFSSAEGNGNDTLVLFLNAGVDNGTPTDLYYLDDLRFDSQ